MAKSQRLTNHIRQQIVGILLKEIEDKNHKKSEEFDQLIFNTIYTTLYTPEEIETIESLPDGWLPKTNYLKMKLNGSVVGGTSDTKHRITQKEDGWGTSFIAEDKLSKAKCKSLIQKQRDIAKDKADFNITRSELRGTLSSITTDKKLQIAWPECYEKVKHLFGEQEVVLLPTVSMVSLNERLGLK